MQLNFQPKPLADFKVQKKAEVDAAVEQIRHSFVTPGSAQSMVYMRKEVEARAYLADPNIDPAAIPHLVQESIRTGNSVASIAQTITEMADSWTVVSSRLEGKRIAVKAAIEAASTHGAVVAACNVDWLSVIAGN